MGREIRRVPANWEHPQDARGHYVPLYDRSYSEKLAEYNQEKVDWDAGESAKYEGDTFEEVCGDTPRPEDYRPDWRPDEMTHYQVYETVSEGTPTSPVFASLDELIVWLIGEGYSKSAAREFARLGWVPSMIFTGGQFYSGIDAADKL